MLVLFLIAALVLIRISGWLFRLCLKGMGLAVMVIGFMLAMSVVWFLIGSVFRLLPVILLISLIVWMVRRVQQA